MHLHMQCTKGCVNASEQIWMYSTRSSIVKHISRCWMALNCVSYWGVLQRAREWSIICRVLDESCVYPFVVKYLYACSIYLSMFLRIRSAHLAKMASASGCMGTSGHVSLSGVGRCSQLFCGSALKHAHGLRPSMLKRIHNSA